MKSIKFLTLIIFLFSGELAFAKDEEVWMYGWRPASTQERYEDYMNRLYVTKPYQQVDYERDVLDLYSELQSYETLSFYCQSEIMRSIPKIIPDLDIRLAYQAWIEKNKEYIEQVNTLWNKFITPLENSKKYKLLEKIETRNKYSISRLDPRSAGDSSSCREVTNQFAYKDYNGQVIANESEDKRFSDAYRNIDFYLHPEKKEAFIKALKKQLNAGLVGERACKKSGGTWQPVGMRQSMACITKYPDAGKSCTDSSQCKGGCMDVTPYNHKGARIGKCRVDDNRFGCFSYLVNGEWRGSMCVD